MNFESIASQLSPHLFWDVKRDELDGERSRRFIIKRVLEYGLWQDWLLIEKYYGLATIATEAQQVRELDGRSLAFISLLSGVPKQQFKCYTTKLSTPAHWNF